MSILTKIVETTRRSVEKRKAETPVGELEGQIRTLQPTRDFAGALRQDDLAVIAEIKRASPSKGWIRRNLDPGTIARQYEKASARAISVLTEPQFFKGGLDDLRAARSAVPLPVLRKDFVVDSYQLYEARAHGADAVLLIAAILSARQLRDLQCLAHELGLHCLVEIYEGSELDKIDWNLTRILGVNNRDLRTFEVDINHSIRLLRTCPPDVIKVSESGLSSAGQLAHVSRHGIDAVLIGESLMRMDHPGRALAALRQSYQQEMAMA